MSLFRHIAYYLVPKLLPGRLDLINLAVHVYDAIRVCDITAPTTEPTGAYLMISSSVIE